MSGNNNSEEKPTEKPVAKPGFWGQIGNVIKTPFNGVIGMGKGAIGNTIGNPLGVGMTALGVAGLIEFAPSLVAWLPFKYKGKTVGQNFADDMKEGGSVALMKDSLLSAAVINAIWGGGTGLVTGLMGTTADKEPEEQSNWLGTTAKIVGGGALAFVVGSVVVGAIHKNGIQYAGNEDNSSKPTPTVPPKTGGVETKQLS